MHIFLLGSGHIVCGSTPSVAVFLFWAQLLVCPFKKIIWHPEDWQSVPGLGPKIYCVLLEVGGWVASWKGGGRCLSFFAVELWAPDKLQEVIGI